MRIGVTNIFKGSAFGGVLPQVALYLAHALKDAGHDVSFLIPFESDEWFIDCTSANTIPFIKLTQGITIQTFDIVIEVVWFLPVDLRRQIANKVVMFYHYPPAFYDIESSVYPLASAVRDFNGVHALWTWSHFKETDFEYLEFMSRRPVFRLPFFWNPILLDSYVTETSVPEWSGSNEPAVVICESNETNTSNCTLPMVILSEIYKNNPSLKWKIVNGHELIKRDFFINNIFQNLHIGSGSVDISGNFMKRVRLPDLRREPNYIISHQRFRPIKYMLLDALYLGIPLIHNCIMLKDVVGGQYYYTLNRIGQALDSWSKITTDVRPALDLVRTDLLSRYGPIIGSCAVNSILGTTITWCPPATIVRPSVRVAFFDMWTDFQPVHNLFLEAFKQNGWTVSNDQTDPTFIIFGPFGQENANIKWTNIPKVFYTGENLTPVNRKDVVLNIGFSTSVSNDYFRMPNWLLELNWYNQDVTLYKNPMPFSLDLLTLDIKMRSKFCIFVATNPKSVCRNTLYHVLSRYKDIDSAGQLFNNVTLIPGGPGGSGGQADKVDTYKNYKFALVCENSLGSGYVTEKLLHAKLGGCVPIYWGSPDVVLDFNKEAFINASDYDCVDNLLTEVERLDNDNNAWLTIANKRLILDLEKPRTLLSEMVKTLSEKVTNFKPENIGASYASSASPTPSKSLQPKVTPYNITPIKEAPPQVIVTCCNGRFVDSAIRLIQSSKVPVYIWVWDIDFMDVKRLKKAGAKMIIPLDTKWNPEWTDFWNPLHFAWKPLVMILAYNVLPKGTHVLYLDAGIEIVDDLDAIWMNISRGSLFVCYMKEHKMETWCHPKFCSMLNLTAEELAAPQLSANIVGFICGGSAGEVLKHTMGYACNPELITGHKWYRYSEKCMGHRHDQSILTLMCLRFGIKPHLLDTFAGYKSYDETLKYGAVLYVHRGNWLKSTPEPEQKAATEPTDSVLKHIQDSYVVNLDHRQDRLNGFWQKHPYLAGFCKKLSAVNGRELKLTAEICKLFKNNDFKWKKSVMGCALSHYTLWKQFASASFGNFLVLEDDAKLCDNFINQWSTMADSIPLDFDIIFLGGVLPPNKPALPYITEPVNRYFARVAKNTVFGQERRYFHFCTYSYIISASGAKKLCAIIDNLGIYTSADHMLVNNMDGQLNIYFTTPLLGGCIQDDDPIYQTADFNNFNRVDKFDSEIWNNTDVFSLEEVAIASSTSTPVVLKPLKVVYFEKEQYKQCIDSEWLREIFQRDFVWLDYSLPVDSGSQVLLYYQHTTPVSVILGWINRNSDCKIAILHASDEQCIADISIYNHPSVSCVFRNYWRPECIGPRVVHLPLGYLNGKGCNGRINLSSQRPLTWTFAGAMDRNNRPVVLAGLVKLLPKNFVHMTPTWGTKEDMPAIKYVGMLQDSQYIPCLDGFSNTESYRFYEALENGAIPVVKRDLVRSYENILCGSSLIYVDDWSSDFTKGIDIDEKQKELVYWWAHFKAGLRKLIQEKLA